MGHESTCGTLEAWSDTWFGDPGSWPPALVAAAERCLASTVPAALAWGPDMRLLYNDAYAELLADQHPGARGRPAWEPASAMWPVVGPTLERVRTTGETQGGDRVALALDTAEGRRTSWYSWTYSPVWCGGEVAGVFAVVHDDTAAELTARHGAALAAAGRVTSAGDVDAALRDLVGVLGALPDVRFAVCHLLEHGGSWTRLAHAGPDLRQPVAASLLDHAERTGRWPVAGVAGPGRSATYVVRPPDPAAGGRGLAASWSVAVVVGRRVVALTVAFAPLVGDPGGHEAFVTDLARAVRGGPG